ncbi:MAG: PrgI family protein [Patescibacteria group bacterium]
MQFKVPQFLDIEDKIFGPFTFREFAYLAGGGGLCYVLFKLLGFWYGAIPILLIGGLAALLTFYKPNNKPFINMLEAGVKYAIQDKLYIWEKRMVKTSEKIEAEKKQKEMETPTQKKMALGESKLKDLAWGLNVLDLEKENKNQ